MPDNETSEKGLGSTGLERLIGRIKAYVIPDGTTIERKQDGTLGLKSGGIQSEFLSNGCVTTNKIASSAVTSDKLADGSVETSSIADSAVTTRTIADASVTPQIISDLAALRGEMGLGSTLGVLSPDYGGTGSTTGIAGLLKEPAGFNGHVGVLSGWAGDKPLDYTPFGDTSSWTVQDGKLVCSKPGRYFIYITVIRNSSETYTSFMPFSVETNIPGIEAVEISAFDKPYCFVAVSDASQGSYFYYHAYKVSDGSSQWASGDCTALFFKIAS